jgi:hypothetical protein
LDIQRKPPPRWQKPGGGGIETQQVLGIVFWDWDTTGVAGIARTIEAQGRAEATGIPGARRNAVGHLATAAQYHAWRGDAKSFAQTADAMRAIDYATDSGGYGAVRDRYQLVLDAQLAVMTRRPDARARLSRLDSVAKTDPQGMLGGLGNLIIARGWEAVGDLPRSVAAIRRTESLNAPGIYYTAMLQDEGRLAALAGDRELAIRAYRRYLALRQNADPPLQRQVQAIRTELQRLEAQSAR